MLCDGPITAGVHVRKPRCFQFNNHAGVRRVRGADPRGELGGGVRTRADGIVRVSSARRISLRALCVTLRLQVYVDLARVKRCYLVALSQSTLHSLLPRVRIIITCAFSSLE